ncbi:MAG TPA: 2-amino-4-hydroxy-6-hydroxymethyldihydropteridine diphosphokinase [Bryobacteraceae bacterium]|jgi:2-amino-4-hydroxy-6-hydroxymethyldihydropteridine diphosphokinase|nr:2-amino-4-hydroxy-6-hydroxymethyldihydropteridine diphosphokinase [Bryobacteraceae bacterium]
MKTVYLGLGSNLGDREAMLQAALRALESPRLHVRRVSPIYETEPMDVPGQHWFLNLVAEAETDLFPLQLLQRTSKIETQLGRRRLAPKGPRNIDIDILLYGNAVVTTAALELPHPRFRGRRFVLAPLADLAPELRDPVTRKTVRALLEELRGQAVRKCVS